MVQINLSAKTVPSGRYKIKVKESGLETPWINNVITDIGLDRMGVANNYCFICVAGSGNSEPGFTDSNLDDLIYSAQGLEINTGNEIEDRYIWARWKYTFSPSASDINVSEVGVGWMPNQLYSRALVLDSLGQPISISVLEGETLEVTYELRMYIDHSDKTGSFTLTGNIGGAYEYISRPADLNTLGSAGGPGWGLSDPFAALSRGYGYWAGEIGTGSPLSQEGVANAYSGDLGPITGRPSNSIANGSGLSQQVMPYVPGTHEIEIRRTIPLARQNGSIRSIIMAIGWGSWQFQFTPAIPKTSDDILVLHLKHSWGRPDAS